MQKTMQIPNNVHVSQVHHNTPLVILQPSSESYKVLVGNSGEWEVEHILDSQQNYWKLQYLVQQAV